MALKGAREREKEDRQSKQMLVGICVLVVGWFCRQKSPFPLSLVVDLPRYFLMITWLLDVPPTFKNRQVDTSNVYFTTFYRSK